MSPSSFAVTVESMNRYDTVKVSDIIILCGPSVTDQGLPTLLWILDHHRAISDLTDGHLSLTMAGSQLQLETLVQILVLELLLLYSGWKLEHRTVRL